MAKPTLTQEHLRARLEYDLETGIFRWRQRHVNTDCDRRWNERWAGKPAGSVQSRGYYRICVDGRDYKQHALAWFYVHGTWELLDHINRDPGDNRLGNLRPATPPQNGANRGPGSNNKSGIKGVCWNSALEKWQAEIRVLGKKRYLGVFDSKDEAAAAYRRAAVDSFGDFASS